MTCFDYPVGYPNQNLTIRSSFITPKFKIFGMFQAKDFFSTNLIHYLKEYAPPV